MFKAPRISVVSPFFNEELIIETAVERMTRNLKRQFDDDWELILVNDGSRDRSLTLLMDLLSCEPNARVRVLSFEHNQGRGRALKTGIDAARGAIVVTTEVDCSWGDDVVQRLVAQLDEHPETDFVIASPHLEGGGLVNVPLSRRLLTCVGNYLIRKFFASHVTMNTGMTRGYRREVIQPLVAHEPGKEFHLEVLLKLITLGFRSSEIPATITWEQPKARPSKKGKRKSSTKLMDTVVSHLQFIAVAQPVRYFAWGAISLLLVGLGMIGAAVYMLFVPGIPSVYLALIGLSLLMFWMLFVGFSVLFFQFRQAMRDAWMAAYPQPHPPCARRAVEVAPLVGVAQQR